LAIISGGDWPQFEKQVLSHLTNKKSFKNLSILPTCGTKFYQYKSGWHKLYSEDFKGEEKAKIITSLTLAVEEQGLSRKRPGASR
jgi:phosphomannomutase